MRRDLTLKDLELEHLGVERKYDEWRMQDRLAHNSNLSEVDKRHHRLMAELAWASYRFSDLRYRALLRRFHAQ